MPDMFQIGSHTYALTLNLFLTGFIGLGFSIVLFYWQRKVKKEDEEKKKLLEEREWAERERHEAVLSSVQSLKEELGQQSKSLFSKIDRYCSENASEHAKMKRNFWKHTHSKNKIFIPEYEP